MDIHIGDTEFWNKLCHGIEGPRKGGARIIVDAENASTGVGKTGLAVGMAQLFAKAFDYDLVPEDFTLSGGEYLQRWREHPDKEQPSVIILDELSGAGAGDSRRGMSTQNVNLGRSWQLMRKKRIVTITTLPHWHDADKKMRRFADYRLWCLEEPIGYFVPYKVGASFDEGHVTTESIGDVDRIKFPNLDRHNDDLYNYVSQLKDDLLDSSHFDADELSGGEGEEETLSPDEARRQERIEIAQRKRNKEETAREIAEDVGMSHTWVLENTEPPEGEA